jgi:hypothetical protein
MSWKQRLTIKSPEEQFQTFGVAPSPDGKRIAVLYELEIKILDGSDGRKLLCIARDRKGHGVPGGSLSLSTGSSLPWASQARCCCIRPIPAKSRQGYKGVTAHRDEDLGGVNVVWGAAFSRNGTLFTAGNDAVRILEAAR